MAICQTFLHENFKNENLTASTSKKDSQKYPFLQKALSEKDQTMYFLITAFIL